MPVPFGHARAILASVQTSALLSGQCDVASSSLSRGDEVAWASPALWMKLQAQANQKRRRREGYVVETEDGGERMGVAVEWPEDRRSGKGKERSLVVWVRQVEQEVSDSILRTELARLPVDDMLPGLVYR